MRDDGSHLRDTWRGARDPSTRRKTARIPGPEDWQRIRIGRAQESCATPRDCIDSMISAASTAAPPVGLKAARLQRAETPSGGGGVPVFQAMQLREVRP
jgi:hypothetical protein